MLYLQWIALAPVIEGVNRDSVGSAFDRLKGPKDVVVDRLVVEPIQMVECKNRVVGRETPRTYRYLHMTCTVLEAGHTCQVVAKELPCESCSLLDAAQAPFEAPGQNVPCSVAESFELHQQQDAVEHES